MSNTNTKIPAKKTGGRVKSSGALIISPKVDSSIYNKESEEYSETDVNLSTNSQESIENLDNPEGL